MSEYCIIKHFCQNISDCIFTCKAVITFSDLEHNYSIYVPRPTAPICCNTLKCMHAHPQAFIRKLTQGGDISLNSSLCLLAPKDPLLCHSLRFMCGYSRIWQRVRAFMRACSGDVRTPQSEEGSGWCANRHFASFSLPPLPTSPPFSSQPSIPQSITFL